MYADTDIECLKSFDSLSNQYDFFSPGPISVLASKPNNPIFLKVFDRIRKNWHVVEEAFMKKKEVERIHHLVSIATERCQGSFVQVIQENISYMNNSIILPAEQLIYYMNNQILFCTKLKLIKLLPFLVNYSSRLKVLSEAYSAEKWGEIRDTTTYNDITKKMRVKTNNNKLSRRFRNWIHENIDPYFVGCS